jgi:hypothetical protein
MSYLKEKDLDPSWAFSADVCGMRREFRKLLDANPEAFATCVREYMQLGEARFPPLETTGGRYPTPKHTLAALLAEYRIAQGEGVTRDSFIAAQELKGVTSASKYSRVSWHNDSTIRDNLKKASRLEKASKRERAKNSEDQDKDLLTFADDVDYWESNFRFLKDQKGGG